MAAQLHPCVCAACSRDFGTDLSSGVHRAFLWRGKIPALYPRGYILAAMDDGEKSGESNDSCQKPADKLPALHFAHVSVTTRKAPIQPAFVA